MPPIALFNLVRSLDLSSVIPLLALVCKVLWFKCCVECEVDFMAFLLCFLLQVGTADAIAFFLPGVVSQFAKVLHVSKTMISGAAGSVEAIDQAIRGLAEFLMLVLEDDANISGLGMSVNASTGFHSNTDDSAISFLEQLRHLPVKSQDQSVMVVENPSEAVRTDSPKFGLKEKGSVNSGNVIGSFHVSRTKHWIIKTSAHVNKLLSATFPHVSSYSWLFCHLLAIVTYMFHLLLSFKLSFNF